VGSIDAARPRHLPAGGWSTVLSIALPMLMPMPMPVRVVSAG